MRQTDRAHAGEAHAFELLAVGFDVRRKQPQAAQRQRPVGVLRADTQVDRALRCRSEGGVVDEEQVAGQGLRVERKQTPARRMSRTVAVGIVGRGGEQRRDGEPLSAQLVMRGVERSRAQAEGVGADTAAQRLLVGLHAGIELRVRALDREQFQVAAVAEAHIAIGDAAGRAARPHLEAELDRHRRGDLVDAAAPDQRVVDVAAGGGRGRRCRWPGRGRAGAQQQGAAQGEGQGDGWFGLRLHGRLRVRLRWRTASRRRSRAGAHGRTATGTKGRSVRIEDARARAMQAVNRRDGSIRDSAQP
ncbi:hypothetical protein V2J18_09255 [Lysobacter firmicutimachus]|uniref:Uncharacterized protein n=1 Tax=Lysobacter firmicutimachus TaxID=1792846 RepID=A0ABU8D1F3_9GAMM